MAGIGCTCGVALRNRLIYTCRVPAGESSSTRSKETAVPIRCGSTDPDFHFVSRWRMRSDCCHTAYAGIVRVNCRRLDRRVRQSERGQALAASYRLRLRYQGFRCWSLRSGSAPCGDSRARCSAGATLTLPLSYCRDQRQNKSIRNFHPKSLLPIRFFGGCFSGVHINYTSPTSSKNKTVSKSGVSLHFGERNLKNRDCKRCQPEWPHEAQTIRGAKTPGTPYRARSYSRHTAPRARCSATAT